ncbi:MAG TPA: HAD-IIIA family hydrolase [Actinospica sp.]|jgi:HAD superfamily hydrolase (TIGR01662 family)|nr:HAD-IIIA family hydrolase [Actinospica sp.]
MTFAFFDLDDTLVDTAGALHAWAADFVREHGLGGEDAVTEVARRREQDVDTWLEFAARMPEWYGIDTDPQELYERIAVEYPAKFSLAPEVADGLVRLREDGWRLGIVTNGSTRMQHAKIDRVGLHEYVDVVLDSESAGYRKPDPRIFELAAGKLGVELGRDGWMVGDRLDKDVAGGNAAGLRTVWLPLGGSLPAVGPRPDHVVASVLDAVDLIAASRAG